MNDGHKIESLAEIFQALSDPNRLRILNLLKNSPHPLCVNALAVKIGITQSAVSQHLKVLRQNGLVKVKKEGYYKHYSADMDVLESVRLLREAVLGSDYRI